MVRYEGHFGAVYLEQPKLDLFDTIAIGLATLAFKFVTLAVMVTSFIGAGIGYLVGLLWDNPTSGAALGGFIPLAMAFCLLIWVTNRMKKKKRLEAKAKEASPAPAGRS